MTARPAPTAVVLSLSNIARDGRVRRHCRGLGGAGWRVIAIGLPDEDGKPADLAADAHQHVVGDAPDWSPPARVLAAMALLGARLVRDIDHHLALALRVPGVAGMVHKLEETIVAHGLGASDLVIANDWSTLPAALIARQRHGLPYHYDTHELAASEHALKRRWRVLFPPLIRAVERAGLASARSVTCVSPGIAGAMAADYGLDRAPDVLMSVPDGPPMAPRPATRPFTVLYHGLFTPGRGLETLLADAEKWPDHLRLVLRGTSPDPRYRARIAALARPGIAADRVRVEPLADPDRILAAANEADFGIFLPDMSLAQNAFALPNKLFEYLYAGITPIVPAGSDMAALLARFNAGIALSDTTPAGLTATLSHLTLDQLQAAKSAASRAAEALHASRHEHSLAARLAAAPASDPTHSGVAHFPQGR